MKFQNKIEQNEKKMEIKWKQNEQSKKINKTKILKENKQKIELKNICQLSAKVHVCVTVLHVFCSTHSIRANI